MNRRAALRAFLLSPLALIPLPKQGCQGDCNWCLRNPDGEPITQKVKIEFSESDLAELRGAVQRMEELERRMAPRPTKVFIRDGIGSRDDDGFRLTQRQLARKLAGETE